MAKKAKTARKKTTRTKKATNKGPRLPEMGVEDVAIVELEHVAQDYVDVRDRRMALTKTEVEKKASVLAVMKKHGKDHYQRDGIEITVVSEAEKVKVRIKGGDDGDDE